jgi:hypothetical protein
MFWLSRFEVMFQIIGAMAEFERALIQETAPPSMGAIPCVELAAEPYSS